MRNRIQSSRQITIEQSQVNAFAQLSGGDGRIHTDEEYARQSKFGRTLVHGLLLEILVEQDLARQLPGWNAHGELEITFRAPVFPGDPITVSISGEPSEMEIEVTRVDGSIAAAGKARVRIPRDHHDV